MIVLNNRNLTKYEVPLNTKELNLAYNNLQTVVQITENLNVLDVSHNKIAMVDGICERNSLSELNLSYNRLISIEGIWVLSKLQVLDISYNFLSPSQLHYIQDLKALKVLNVSHNHFASEEALTFLNALSQLHELNLSFNDFLSWSLKHPMPNLKKLILDNNKIKTLNMQTLPNLETLSCIENNIIEIFGLASLSKLSQLFVDSNDLCELPPLTNIKVLSASHNKLNTLPSFPNVQMLNVSFNLLNCISKISVHVVQLIVGDNCLVSLPCGMKDLQVLEASNNKLSNLGFLAGCEKLSVLRVAYNEFLTVESLFSSLKKCPLSDLDLSGVAVSKEQFKRLLRYLPDLEKLNGHLISVEDKERAGNSQEVPFLSDEEPVRTRHTVGIQDVGKAGQLKIDPNSSEELVGKKHSINEFGSPRSVCLTPSHTETVSIIPVSSTPKPEIASTASPKEYMSYKMREMYRSIVHSMKKNISKEFSEFAQEHNIPHKAHRHHHHCRHHVCRQKLKNHLQNIEKKTYKGAESNHLKFTFNENEIMNRPDIQVSYSPIPEVNRNNEEFIIKGIVKYAKIPPRPVLRNEKNKRIEAELVNSSQEFLLIGSYFAQKGVRVLRVLKIFELGKNGVVEFDDIYLCYAYSEWDENDGIEGLLKNRIKAGKRVVGNSGVVLVCVGDRDNENEFVGESGWDDEGLLVPAYLVWYTR